MTFSKKIKSINSKIEQNKAWYNLDRQTAKIFALSLGNVSTYEFLSGEDISINQKIWISSLRHWVDKADWNCKITVSRIRQGSRVQ